MILRWLVLSLALVAPVWADEAVVLTTPVPKPTLTTWNFDRVTLSGVNKSVEICLSSDAGDSLCVLYPTPAPASHPSQPTGQTILHAINTANLTSNSLIKRLLNQLVTDGYLVGAVSGSPF